jgi:hypothetical protein
LVQLNHGGVGPNQLGTIILVRACFGVDVHRPKFKQHENFPAVTDPLLAVEDWARRTQPDYRHYKKHERQPDGRGHKNAAHVQGSLPSGETFLPDLPKCCRSGGVAVRTIGAIGAIEMIW